MLTEFVASLVRRRRTPRCAARIVTTWSELEPLREDWNRLHAQTPDANFFQSWFWFATYWHHFGEGRQLRVVVVEDPGGCPIGIVPLVVQSDERSVPFRRLMYPLDNWGTEFGPLGPNPGESLRTALSLVSRFHDAWDVIDLRWIAPGAVAETVAAFEANGFRANKTSWAQTARIDLSQGWETYWAGRSSKFRNNQRRAEKALRRLGAVRFVHFCPESGESQPRFDLFETCEAVAGASWQGASVTGNTLGHPRIAPFLRDLHVRAVGAGQVYLSLMFVDEIPAAFTYNYRCGGRVHGLRMGYDLRFKEAGAGGVLLAETIRESCRRGDRLFDLGESPSTYKRHWETESVETFRIRHRSLGRCLRRIFTF